MYISVLQVKSPYFRHSSHKGRDVMINSEPMIWGLVAGKDDNPEAGITASAFCFDEVGIHICKSEDNMVRERLIWASDCVTELIHKEYLCKQRC